MDFTLSKQQQMVQKMYREFAENEPSNGIAMP